jgi:hypothetical protein
VSTLALTDLLVGVAGGVLVALVVASVVLAVGARLGARVGRRPTSAAWTNRAPPALAGPATIAFLGDVQRGIRDVARPLVDALARESAGLLISSGDLASHGEAPYYGIVARALDEAGLAVPMLVVPGNHDLEPGGVRDAGPGRALFEAAVGPRAWRARVGPLLVVGVDDAAGPVEAAHLALLEESLAGAPTAPWILVCHKPPRRIDRPGSEVIPGAERLVALCEARPPVAVVSGHLRDDADVTVLGVRYLANVRGGDFEKRRLFAPPEFRLLLCDVSETGAASFRWVSVLRRGSWRTAWRQLVVRAWAESRRGVGRLVAAPAGALLGVVAPARAEAFGGPPCGGLPGSGERP